MRRPEGQSYALAIPCLCGRNEETKGGLEGTRAQEAEVTAVSREGQVMRTKEDAAADAHPCPHEDGEVVRAIHQGGHLEMSRDLPRWHIHHQSNRGRKDFILKNCSHCPELMREASLASSSPPMAQF
jgi:hypothetical protein